MPHFVRGAAALDKGQVTRLARCHRDLLQPQIQNDCRIAVHAGRLRVTLSSPAFRVTLPGFGFRIRVSGDGFDSGFG